MLRSSCKLRSLTRHLQASSTFWLVYVGAIGARIKRSLIRWVTLTMTLKSYADAWSAKSRFVRLSRRFKMANSMITCRGRRGDCRPLDLLRGFQRSQLATYPLRMVEVAGHVGKHRQYSRCRGATGGE